MTPAIAIAGSPSSPTAADPKLAFRADINGLRAIAVLAVLAFHFEIAPFRGGFVGVDIFFVISGYLMTAIILGRLERGTFSIAGFYLERARRIVPALATLVALLLAAGALFLLADEYRLLARQAGSSVLFVSNFQHWRETGYFEPGLDQKWLLHSWTLSLEWQFYLLYPLVLPLLARLFPEPRRLLLVLAAAACLSFGLMLALSRSAPAAGFYLLPPRAWELLAGAMLYLVPPLTGRTARVAQVAGLGLIAASVALIGPDGWPDGRAIAPIAGTMLVILAARTGSRVTGNGIAAWIGLNSYSIYLWHWPIVVALRRSGHSGDWPWIAAGMAGAFLLGHLSYRFVERAARPRASQPRIGTARIAGSWRSGAALATPPLALALASLGIWKSQGVPQRFSEQVQAVVRESIPRPVAGAGPCYAAGEVPPEPCRLGPSGAPVIATLLGDSHADAQLLGLIEAVPADLRGAIEFNALAGCPPVLGLRPLLPRSRCGVFNSRFLDPLAAPRKTPLILTASWAGNAERPKFRFPGDGGAEPNAASFRAALLRSSCALAAGGPTYVVLPTPQFPFSVSRALQRRLIADPKAADVAMPRSVHESRNRAIVATLREAERRCGVRLLDPAPYLCRAGECQGSVDHRPLYRDDHHLTGTPPPSDCPSGRRPIMSGLWLRPLTPDSLGRLMPRRVAPLLFAPLLASCQPPDVVVRAGFIGNALAFVATDPGDSSSFFCWSEGTVVDDRLRPVWRFTGPRTGECEEIFPLVYGQAPSGALTQVEAAPLEPGRLYLFIGNATAGIYGAFAFTRAGTTRLVHNVDPDSPAADSLRQRYWRQQTSESPAAGGGS
jgi:peptidoglycan/LPS O-acetylase OafA/YrhL